VKRQPHLRDQVRHIDPLNSVLPAVARTSIWAHVPVWALIPLVQPRANHTLVLRLE